MSAQSLSLQSIQKKIDQLAENAPATQLSEKERVARAKATFVKHIDRDMAVNLETCIHCGMCAEVCHFYEATQEARYTPVYKLEPLKRVFRRELSPLRWLYRLLTPDVTLQQLAEWQPLVYDACTLCGRCDMICPMGINLSAMINVMRQGLAAAELAPDAMRALDREQTEKGTQLGIGQNDLDKVIAEIAAQGIEIPRDKKKAQVMVLTTALDVVLFKNSLSGMAKILNHLKLDWTLQSDCFEAANAGYNSGDEIGQKLASDRIIKAAEACGAKMVIIPECGHAYPALRFEAARKQQRPLSFTVMAMAEFIGREISAGRLQVRPIGKNKKVTYHDPCKLGRHGGVFDEPRQALASLGVDFRETESHAQTNYCCGGGSGVHLLKSAASLRQRAFQIKIRQVDATGADSVVTSCDTCRFNFISGASKANWNKPVESLVELVADNLVESK